MAEPCCVTRARCSNGGSAPYPLTHSARRETVRPVPDTQATIEAMSDEALARRIASGGAGVDAEEAELYRRFAPRVRLYGRRHLQDDTAADDLAQDVLLL